MSEPGAGSIPEPETPSMQPASSIMNRQKLAASRLWAASRFPYLASALFACTIVSMPELGGIAVDEHWRLYVDPQLVDEWSVPQVGSLMVHHTGHLLRDHADRARSLGIDRSSESDWALAADAEINDDLNTEQLTVPGEFVLPNALGCEPGKLAEEYFAHLRKKKEQTEDGEDGPDDQHGPNCAECGSGAHGQHRDWEQPGGGGVGPSTAKLIRCQVASEICNHAGKNPGTIPLGMLRWAQELLQPKVDWRKALAAEIRRGIASTTGKVDYTYMRPSRRQSISPDVILPSLRRPVPEVAIVCDTSGSMGERELGEALAEVEGILRAVGTSRERLRLLSVDTAVHAVKRVSSARNIELFGGGGTDMGAGITAAASLRPKPAVVVVLTDGYTPWPDTAPKGVHVVVGLIGAAPWKAPGWAKVIRIEDAA